MRDSRDIFNVHHLVRHVTPGIAEQFGVRPEEVVVTSVTYTATGITVAALMPVPSVPVVQEATITFYSQPHDRDGSV